MSDVIKDLGGIVKVTDEVHKRARQHLKKVLVGQTITNVRLLSKQDLRDNGWDEGRFAVILCTSGDLQIMAYSDEEGNDVGHLSILDADCHDEVNVAIVKAYRSLKEKSK